MLTFDKADLRPRLESQAGKAPPILLAAFSDLEENVQLSKRRLRSSPFIVRKDRICGFIFDIKSSGLKEVCD